MEIVLVIGIVGIDYDFDLPVNIHEFFQAVEAGTIWQHDIHYHEIDGLLLHLLERLMSISCGPISLMSLPIAESS